MKKPKLTTQTIIPKRSYGAMGGRGNKASYANNDVTGFNGNRGNSSTYRISRLKRDHPEVAARVEAGEFKTVADAERAAGIKPPKQAKTPLDKALDAIRRMTPEERSVLRDVLDRIDGQGRG